MVEIAFEGLNLCSLLSLSTLEHVKRYPTMTKVRAKGLRV